MLNAGLLAAVKSRATWQNIICPDTLKTAILVVPLLLFTGLLAGVAWSLPTPLRRPFVILLAIGGRLCVGSVWLAWFATHFLRGKW